MPEVTGTILDAIVRATAHRYRNDFSSFDPDKVQLPQRPAPRGLAGLRSGGFGLIAEIKSASPSLGRISDSMSFEQRLLAYEMGGAAAISVLTEPEFFGGNLERLDQARAVTDLPLLRKDFIIHPLMVVEAYAHGADWILLIAALLNDGELERLFSLCASLGMLALVEVHTRGELDRVLQLNPDLIGINNRNLHTFEVCLETCLTLRKHIPDHIAVVAESGISSVASIRELKEAGFCGALVGEALMRDSDPQGLLQKWLAP